MTSQMPGSPQEHYENLLADHYEWMFGLPFEAKVEEQKAILDEFIGKEITDGLAVDMGCGSEVKPPAPRCQHSTQPSDPDLVSARQ